MQNEKNILDSVAYKKNPFEVPENYFSDFSKNLEEKIISTDASKKISIFTKMKPWMYIAASLLLFVGGIQWYISKMVGTEELVENTETMEIANEEATMLYAYVDDLMLMDYLISEND
ncbi:MAG: hypothetical protein LBR52_01000 [Prevotellaceae bacterium]|jgi:hypothetical protein|nr:hypothetical protein [Prevotellaceae bacterium]